MSEYNDFRWDRYDMIWVRRQYKKMHGRDWYEDYEDKYGHENPERYKKECEKKLAKEREKANRIEEAKRRREEARRMAEEEKILFEKARCILEKQAEEQRWCNEKDIFGKWYVYITVAIMITILLVGLCL